MPDNPNIIPLDTFLLGLEQRKGGLNRTLNEDPQTTAELAHRLALEPLPDGITPADTTALPTSLPPSAYVLHHHSSRCLACNNTTIWSATYALYHRKGHWTAERVRHLIPIQKLEWNLPIHTTDIPQTTTPFCVQCVTAAQDYVATLPRPPEPKAPINTLKPGPTLTAQLKPQSAPQARAPRQQREKFTPITNSDDLMS